MHNTQVSVWEIQHLSILCQYQDTVELQETLLLEATKCIMDNHSLQEIRTMMMPLLTTVHNYIKVPGGMPLAMIRISMVYTVVGHRPPIMMVWSGSHGGDTATLLNSLRWKWGRTECMHTYISCRLLLCELLYCLHHDTTLGEYSW